MYTEMALSQHQLDKAKKAIEFLSSLPTGSGEGSGTSGASQPSPSTQSTSVRGSVNLSERSLIKQPGQEGNHNVMLSFICTHL